MDQTTNQEHPSEEEALAGTLESIGQVLLVLSGKGGVGKSTVAANIAVALAGKGHAVGLLDIDIHGPSIPGMLNLAGSSIFSNDKRMLPVEFTPNLKVMSIGFLTPNDKDAVIWRGPMKYGVIKQFLTDVDWGALDYLVVDSPPGTGDEPLSIAQMVVPKARAVVVTTPQKVSLDAVGRCVTFCRKLDLPVAGIIENMSGFECPHCGQHIDLFDSGGGETLAKEMDVPFLGKIPIDIEIVKGGDTGEPIVLKNREGNTARIFNTITGSVVGYDI
ncbi:MAG: Mrp/NBP35 family ATP-binding protein [Candidatus Latescibacteria bacterium]|nr:Mrp/NBP35 family ATP-binding protein [Candidatus Latescibacterota bacterium]